MALQQGGFAKNLCRTLPFLLLATLSTVTRSAELVKDINEQPSVDSSNVTQLGRAGTQVIFSAGYRGNPTDLGIWRTDGTSSGTQRLVAPSASTALFDPAPLASTGSLALWGARNPTSGAGIGSYALWVSDGTAAGTFKLIESGLGPMSLVGVLPANVVVFRVAQSELWRTDGTVAGTWRLGTFVEDAALGIGARVADRIYFAARTANEGAELWVTDGSNVPANTHLALDVEPGAVGSSPEQLTSLDNELYFTATSGGIKRLWRRDAAGNFEQLTGNTLNASIKCTVDDLVYFTLGSGGQESALWRTDGTVAGSIELLALSSTQGLGPDTCKAAGNRAFFPLFSSGVSQLWQSDGTIPGTAVTSFVGGSQAMQLLHWSGTHWFVALSDGAFNYRLWATDGASDTRQVALTLPAEDIWGFHVAGVGTHVLVAAKHGSMTPLNPFKANGLELWRVDGDGRNSLRLTDDVRIENGTGISMAEEARQFLVSGAQLFYKSWDELSVTDGTIAGTGVLRQIVPNGTGSSLSGNFAAGADATLFVAYDGLTGRELWRTDASTGGTLQVADIKPGSGGSAPANLQRIGQLTFFDADDGTHGRELWVSDGTQTGTRMIADAQPGSNGWTFSTCPKLQMNGFIYFGVNGTGGGLWRTDGTAAGTTFVAAQFACPLAVTGSTLYFSSSNGVHNSLWRTDGTAQGTSIVAGLKPFGGPAVVYRDELVFTTSSPQLSYLSTGAALWTMAGGTPRLVMDFTDPVLGAATIAWVSELDDALYIAVGRSSTHAGIYKWTGGTEAPQLVTNGVTVDPVASRWVLRLGSRLVFDGSSTAEGPEIFATDGTASGTVAITDLGAPGDMIRDHRGLVTGAALYFEYSEYVGGPRQLARTNGTIASFEPVTDLISNQLLSVGTAAGQVIFATDDIREAIGNELYVVRNAMPLAAPDSASVASGQSVAIQIAANDSDVDGQVMQWGARIVTAPANGTVTIDASGVAQYRANAAFTGSDSFTYVAADNAGGESAPATVTVTVTAQSGSTPPPSTPNGSTRRGGGGSMDWLLLLGLALLTALAQSRGRSDLNRSLAR